MEILDFSRPPAPSLFRQDKIECNVGEWRLSGDNNEVVSFLNYLPSFRSRNDSRLTDNDLGWIFRRPSGGYFNANSLNVRNGRDACGRRPPLFGGLLRVIEVSSGEDRFRSIAVRDLRMNLRLNPTRFLAHQMLPAGFSGGSMNSASSPPIDLMECGVGRLHTGLRRRTRELVLDRNDNVLLFAEWEAYGGPELWTLHVRRYMEGVINAIQSEFDRASRLSCAAISRNNFEYLLNSVENYVDFHVPDGISSIEFLNGFESHLTAFSRETRIDRYNRGSAVTHGYYRSYTLSLRAGVSMKVYAKTIRRIRFEVSYNLSECRELLHPNSTSLARSSERLDEILDWFQLLQQDAASRVEQLFSFLYRRLGNRSPQRPAYMLPVQISNVLNDTAVTNIVLSSLLSAGGITLDRGDPLRGHIRKLIESGILERSQADGNRCRTFTVTPQYLSGLEYLRRDPNRRFIRRRSRRS